MKTPRSAIRWILDRAGRGERGRDPERRPAPPAGGKSTLPAPGRGPGRSVVEVVRIDVVLAAAPRIDGSDPVGDLSEVLASAHGAALRRFDTSGLAPHLAEAAVLREASSRNADLVVVAWPAVADEEGAAPPPRGYPSRLVRASRVPVLVVPSFPADARRSAAVLPIRTVLVPSDFSPPSDAALRHAGELAAALGSDLVVLLVVAEVDSSALHPPKGAGADPAEHYLGALRERSGRLVPSELVSVAVRVARGDPASEILRAAEEVDADLIVMASHGVGGVRRQLLGSTADGVLAAADRPVLCLKAAGRGLLSGGGRD